MKTETKESQNTTMIPKHFYKAEMPKPHAKTVGELKLILAELPDSLRISHDFDEPITVTVYNHSHDDEHVEFGAYHGPIDD